jgi:hypothetical protein
MPLFVKTHGYPESVIDDFLSGAQYQLLSFQDKNRCISWPIYGRRIVKCNACFGLSAAIGSKDAADSKVPIPATG